MRGTDNPLARAISPITRLLAILCGLWLLGYSLLVCVDIVARRHFGVSLQGTDEIGGYTGAALAAFGFAHALIMRRHTRIELFLAALPSWGRALGNAVAALAIAAFAAFLAWRGWHELSDSIDFMSVSNSPLQVPLWIPQGAWFAGLLVFSLVAVPVALHALGLLLRGRFAELNRWYGPPTVSEEIAAETTRHGAGEDRR